MKILVTGGAGFIGSHLVDRLIKEGYQTVIIDDLSSGKRVNINKSAKFYKIDIVDKKIKDIFHKENFDIVFHLAAQKNVRTSIIDPIYDANINILGSINVLENCVKCKVRKFIYTSTGGAIYGDAKIMPTPESYLPQPNSPYGIAKLAIDNYLYFYQLVHQLNFVSFRLSNVYGPRQDPEGEAGVVAIFIDKILSNKTLIINGSGRQTRDYIYVDDVVNVFVNALNKNACGYFNIGTGKETSVIKLYKIITKVSGTTTKVKHGPPIKGELKWSALDARKAMKNFNWKSVVKLNQGLKSTYQWFKKEYEKKSKK